MGTWGFLAIFAPGIALIIAGNALMFRAQEHAQRQRNARIIILGFTLLYLVPGVAFFVLVVVGRMQPAMLIGAVGLIGLSLLRIYGLRAD